MFKNRVSGYFSPDSPDPGSTPPVDPKSKSADPNFTSGFAVVPNSGMSGFYLPAVPSSIYELARREAIARSQERLLSLLRSRWEFLKKAEG